MPLSRYNMVSLVAFQRVADIVINSTGHGMCDADNLKHKDIIWCHTDRAVELFFHLQKHTGSYILITGAADLSVSERLFKLRPSCIKKWFVPIF